LSVTVAAVGDCSFTVKLVAELHVVPRQTYGAPLQSAVVAQVVLHSPDAQA